LESEAKEIEKLSQETENKDFWQDSNHAKEVMKNLDALKERRQRWNKLHNGIEETGVLYQLAEEEKDKETLKEVISNLSQIEKDLERWHLEVLLSGPYDKNGCFLTIQPGAGGTESCDWAQMLLRMYIRWAERNNRKAELIDISAGEEAGIKHATLDLPAEFSYGYLKGERGIHRLVRISPFDSGKRRHTSFASVEVFPKISEEIEFEVNDSDLKIETFRASGPGGQHVNVTDSAVRITHMPTGITAQAQSERSQHQNRHTALTVLKARLHQYFEEKEKEKQKELQGEKKNIEWGNQIRSYTLHPYMLVKDHRTGTEQPNAEGVLDGDIDPFIFSYLKEKDKWNTSK
jgi:peptide chain release factor 2